MITETHVEPLAPPFEIETDEYRQAALDWVNKVRSKLGHEALSDLRPADAGYGNPNYASHCPIATSIREGSEHVAASARTYAWQGRSLVFKDVTPIGAVMFINLFDSGEYPDLRPSAS